jgi:hypothetical protein
MIGSFAMELYDYYGFISASPESQNPISNQIITVIQALESTLPRTRETTNV